MSLIDNKTELNKYAELYISINRKGTSSLPYRVLPGILQKYLTGNYVLDFGCGAGFSTHFLKSQNLNVKSVDINPNMIDKAKIADPQGVYLHMQEGAVPFSDREFDMVFASFVLLEIDTKEKMQKALNEISRVLKKGAHFITLVDNENTYNHDWTTIKTNFPENANVKSGDKVKIEFLDSKFAIYDTYWSKEDYIKFHNQAGLDVIEINNPIIQNNNEFEWKDELHTAPISIFISVKK
jgi:ubiquinone/menaquinone biosynthesis C-methylase UbiE